MFPMTITLNNAAQLNAVLAALNPEQIAQAAAKTEAPKDKATTAKKQDAAATTQPTAEAVVADAPSKKADDFVKSEKAEAKTETAAAKTETAAAKSETAGASAPTYEDAKKVVLALSAQKGRTALEALLKDFGATKLPDVKPEQYAEVIAAANKLLGA